MTPFGGRTSHPRAHSHTWRATLKVLGFSLLVLLAVCVATDTHVLPVSMYYYIKAVFNFLPPGISKRYRDRVTQLWRSVDSSGARGALTMQ